MVVVLVLVPEEKVGVDLEIISAAREDGEDPNADVEADVEDGMLVAGETGMGLLVGGT